MAIWIYPYKLENAFTNFLQEAAVSYILGEYFPYVFALLLSTMNLYDSLFFSVYVCPLSHIIWHTNYSDLETIVI